MVLYLMLEFMFVPARPFVLFQFVHGCPHVVQLRDHETYLQAGIFTPPKGLYVDIAIIIIIFIFIIFT